jgi:hypothetical protein
MSRGLSFYEVAEVFKCKDASNGFLVEHGQTLLLISGPCLRYPRYYALGFFAQEETFALIFVRGSFIRVLIKACRPSVVARINFEGAVALVVLVSDVEIERPV